MAKARANAEAAATAAGGSVAALVELVVDPFSEPRPLMQQSMGRVAMAESTPIEPGEMSVQAMVRVRWEFVPKAR